MVMIFVSSLAYPVPHSLASMVTRSASPQHPTWVRGDVCYVCPGARDSQVAPLLLAGEGGSGTETLPGHHIARHGLLAAQTAS